MYLMNTEYFPNEEITLLSVILSCLTFSMLKKCCLWLFCSVLWWNTAHFFRELIVCPPRNLLTYICNCNTVRWSRITWLRAGSRERLLEDIRELARQREWRRVPGRTDITFTDRKLQRMEMSSQVGVARLFVWIPSPFSSVWLLSST